MKISFIIYVLLLTTLSFGQIKKVNIDTIKSSSSVKAITFKNDTSLTTIVNWPEKTIWETYSIFLTILVGFGGTYFGWRLSSKSQKKNVEYQFSLQKKYQELEKLENTVKELTSLFMSFNQKLKHREMETIHKNLLININTELSIYITRMVEHMIAMEYILEKNEPLNLQLYNKINELETIFLNINAHSIEDQKMSDFIVDITSLTNDIIKRNYKR